MLYNHSDNVSVVSETIIGPAVEIKCIQIGSSPEDVGICIRHITTSKIMSRTDKMNGYINRGGTMDVWTCISRSNVAFVDMIDPPETVLSHAAPTKWVPKAQPVPAQGSAWDDPAVVIRAHAKDV